MILNDDGTYDSMSEEEMEALEQVAMHRQLNEDEDDQMDDPSRSSSTEEVAITWQVKNYAPS